MLVQCRQFSLASYFELKQITISSPCSIWQQFLLLYYIVDQVFLVGILIYMLVFFSSEYRESDTSES